MSGGNIVDVHDVESGIDIRGRAPGSGIENDLSGRRRLDVSRPDGR